VAVFARPRRSGQAFVQKKSRAPLLARGLRFPNQRKKRFLAAGLSLAHPGNVRLNLSVSLLLKRGQRLLLLRR
jgi:hypothetical protein